MAGLGWGKDGADCKKVGDSLAGGKGMSLPLQPIALDCFSGVIPERESLVGCREERLVISWWTIETGSD